MIEKYEHLVDSFLSNADNFLTGALGAILAVINRVLMGRTFDKVFFLLYITGAGLFSMFVIPVIEESTHLDTRWLALLTFLCSAQWQRLLQAWQSLFAPKNGKKRSVPPPP